MSFRHWKKEEARGREISKQKKQSTKGKKKLSSDSSDTSEEEQLEFLGEQSDSDDDGE